jgi:signal transduction histidine kinase/CheY-like chemotaxis protein
MQRRPSFDDLFRLSPNAYLVLDPAFVILDANPAYLTLAGRSREDLCGRRLQDVYCLELQRHEGGLRQMLDSLARVVARGAGEQMAPMCLNVLGETGGGLGEQQRYWSVSHTPLLSEGGEVTAVLQHVVDITEQRRAEKQLAAEWARLGAQISESARELAGSEARRKSAEGALLQARKLEAIGKLTGGVAHDFNNMLQIIGGNLQLLRRSLAGNEAAERRLDSAVSGVQRAANLASQLLAFAGRQRQEPQVVELRELLEQMRELLNGSLGRGAPMDIEIQPGLWPVFADVGSLQGVILNLAIDTRDALAGSGRLSLRACNRSLDAATASPWPQASPGDYVRLSLIGEADAANDAFFTQTGDGTVLDTVGDFARQSGGFVVLEEREGREAAVHIHLPRKQDAAVGNAPVVEDSPADPAESAGRGLRVLLVEDDPTLRMLTGEVIGELGHHVVLCESAEGALEQLAAQPFDVLLTDVGLAGMNGIELARQARACDPRLAIVIASGYAVDPEAQGLAGVQAMLKPYDLHQVRALLATIQGTHGG